MKNKTHESIPPNSDALEIPRQKRTFAIRPTLLAIAIAQVLAVPCAQAASILVDNGGDADAGCTLREAVASINDGDVGATGCSNSGGAFGSDDQVSFSVPSVGLSLGNVYVKKSLSINGGSAGVNLYGNNGVRLFRLETGGTRIILNNLTLSGGTHMYGGAILANGVELTLMDCTVSGNEAFRFGGGGINVSNTTLSLINSTVSGNSAERGGGGIEAISSSVSLVNSIVSGNISYIIGGGILAGNSRVSLSNSTVSGNMSYNDGGGIYASSSSSVSLSNSTVSGNLAYSYGGGISAYSGSSVNLSNSTLSGNSAYHGGGIDAHDSSMTLSNSIIANSAGDDCSMDGGSSITADNHNIIEDGSCSTSALSMDPKLGPLANNGGPTKTHALLTGSPAIDAGDNAACSATPVNNLDQRGGVRPVGSACDIGAYEFGAIVGPGPGTPFSMVPLPDGKGGYFFLPL